MRNGYMEKEERFFFNGVFYSSQEDFFRASSEYANSKISHISAERIMEDMIKGICLNMFIQHESKLTNAEFSELCARFSYKFITEYRKKNEK